MQIAKSHSVRCGACGDGFVSRYVTMDGLYFCRRESCKMEGKRMRREARRLAVPQKAKSSKKKILRLEVSLTLGPLYVVDDPLDVGGWPMGKRFSQDEWQEMVRFLTFTPGTVLRDRFGRLYRFDLVREDVKHVASDQ